MRIIEATCRILNRDEPLVLATITDQSGSTPRTSGAKMIIRHDGNIIGTIGGGMLEARVIEAGLALFDAKENLLLQFDLADPNLSDSMDLICGGRLNVLLEHIDATHSNRRVFRALLDCLQKEEKTFLISAFSRDSNTLRRFRRFLLKPDGSMIGTNRISASVLEKIIAEARRLRSTAELSIQQQTFLVEPMIVPKTVYLFGAGHVAQYVAAMAKMAEFRVRVLDDRDAFANRERFETADDICVVRSFDHAFENLRIDRNALVVIVTRGHVYDKTVLAQALRTRASYIGMIGSRRKRETIYDALRREGFGQSDIDRVKSPIGLDIGAETPAEIAVSIVAELIAKRVEYQ